MHHDDGMRAVPIGGSRSVTARWLLVWPLVMALLAACTSARRVGPSALTPSVRVDAAMLAMADARRANVPLLDSMLQTVPRDEASKQRQRRAVLLIGQLRLRERYALLRTLSTHPDTALSATAVFALGLVRDTASIAVLSDVLGGAADGTAAEAAWALGMIGEPAREVLQSALQRVHEGGRPAGPAQRGALLRAAAALRPVPIARVTPFLHDADARVASAAAYAIARSRAAGGARALLAQAEHADPAVRAQVAAGAAPALIGDSLVDVAMRALLTLAADADLQVRVQAVRSAGLLLARWDSTGVSPAGAPAIRDAVLVALRDAMAPVRVTAAESVAPVLGRDEGAWQRAVDGDSTFMVQRALLDAGSRRGVLGATRTAWQQHPDAWRRLAAFEFANRAPILAPPESALVRSAWARADAAPRVRAAAASALTSAASRAEVRAVLDAMRADPDALVRANAVAALASRASAADATWALALYRAESAPEGHVVRSAALRVISTAWRRDSAGFDAGLRRDLSMLPVPSDPLVRRGVRELSPLAHWALVEGPIVSTGDYERIAATWLAGGRRATARLHTQRGVITLELLASDAPLTVDNFVQLAQRHYFNGTRFHRVIAGFVAQDGDPTGTGSGGPGRSVRDELNRHRYARGAVGMALSGPDTGGSQYFLTLTPQPHLDGGYTVFAQVIDGFDVMDALVLGDRIVRVEVR